MENFNYIFYINKYKDLKHLKTKQQAWDHYIKHGISEGRTCNMHEINNLNNSNINNIKDLSIYI